MAAIFQIKRGTADISSSIVDGELYLNKTKNSLQVSNGDSNPITLAKINETNSGSLILQGNVTASNAYFSGDVAISGNLFLGNNSSDNISALGVFTTDLNAGTTNTYNIGSTGSVWKNIYANSVSASAFTGSLFGMGNPTSFSTSVDSRLDLLELSSSLYDNAMSGSKRLYVSPSGSNSNDGSDPSVPFLTIKAAVESLGVINPMVPQRYTIYVGSGEYTEQNPIVVPTGVAIVGDTLRTVRLTAANPTKDFFHCHDSNYFYGLRFLDLKYPSFAFSFPCSTATGSISAGSVSSIGLVHTMTGYPTNQTGYDIGIVIEGPNLSGSSATATINTNGSGEISQINVVSGGTNYADGEKIHISIPAPASQRPFITTSPYVQNCSSITGPFNTSGVKVLQALPYSESAFNIDAQGAGGGIRIDGNLVSSTSPLESFVADAFTQVNQGGPGHLVINKGYAQFVSCFTTFCTYGFKVVNGGFANISNSVIDFGNYGLISKTYFPQTYNTGSSLETLSSYVTSAEILQDGAGYTGSIASVTISGGGGTGAIATASVNAFGSIDDIIITNSGSGYTSEPNLTIATPTGASPIQATVVGGKANISGIPSIKFQLQSGSRGVDVSSNMILNGIDYLVTSVATGSNGNERYVSTYPSPPSVTTGDKVYFHQLSNISTGGLVMEYVGSGVTYNALPKFGGVPNRNREITEYAPGRVFYSTVDNIGNIKVGDFFSVNQLTGEVTIDARSFNLSGINNIGPFKRNGVAVGVVLQEVSNNTTLLDSQFQYGETVVPTQYAVKGYIDVRDNRLNNLETTSASVNGHISDINTYTASLKTALDVTGGNTRIKGNLIVDGTQTSLNTTETFIEDMSITLASGSTTSGIADGAGFNIAGANVSMSWNDANTRLYFNTNIAALGSISSSTLVGLNNASVTTYSTSVDSRLSNLQTKSASVDISVTNINSFTASQNTKNSTLSTYTSSVDNRFTNLEITSASVDTLNTLQTTRIDQLAAATASVNSYTSSNDTTNTTQNNRLSRIEESTASLNSFTASNANTSLNAFTQSVPTTYEGIANASKVLVSGSSQLTASYDTRYSLSGSVLTSFSTSVDARLDGVEYTASLFGGGLTGQLTQLNEFTASINNKTGSFATTGSNSFNGSQQITGSLLVSQHITGSASASFVSLAVNTLTPTQKIHLKGAVGIENGTTAGNLADQIVFGYAGSNLSQYTHRIQTSHDAQAALNRMDFRIANSSNTWESPLQLRYDRVITSGSAYVSGDLVVTGSINGTIYATNGVVSGSAQITPILPTGVVSGSAQTIANLPTGVVSGSIQVLGGSTIMSGSTNNYQFNSIGVGSTTAASGVNGEIRAQGDITAYYSSDERLKENIQPIVDALSKVESISGNTYDWKEGFETIHSHTGHDIGVIAQEIEKVLPEVVIDRETGYKAVQYEKIVPLLIEAIKELSAKVKELESK